MKASASGGEGLEALAARLQAVKSEPAPRAEAARAAAEAKADEVRERVTASLGARSTGALAESFALTIEEENGSPAVLRMRFGAEYSSFVPAVREAIEALPEIGGEIREAIAGALKEQLEGEGAK